MPSLLKEPRKLPESNTIRPPAPAMRQDRTSDRNELDRWKKAIHASLSQVADHGSLLLLRPRPLPLSDNPVRWCILNWTRFVFNFWGLHWHGSHLLRRIITATTCDGQQPDQTPAQQLPPT